MQHGTHGVWDQIVGRWNQMRGEVRRVWGELTDDELEQIAGNRDKFVGKLQERYGIAKVEAERQVDEWADRLDMETRR